MNLLFLLLIGGSSLSVAIPLNAQSTNTTTGSDFTQYVNVFIGTDTGGNDFPGPCRPFGMVRLGPDVEYEVYDAYSGYQPEGHITGFSFLHTSGMGGAPKYGVVSQIPIVGKRVDIDSPLSVARLQPDDGGVGWYTSVLEEGVTVNLAATERAGMIEYNFSGENKHGNVVIDVSHVLPSHKRPQWSQHYVRGNISYDASDGHYEGSGTYDNGWNSSPAWTVYFCGYFDKSGEVEVFHGSGEETNFPVEAVSSSHGDKLNIQGAERVGLIYQFANPGSQRFRITSRVGISFISASQACENVNREIPSGTLMEEIIRDTQAIWNERVLSKVTISGATDEQLHLLYSSLYNMHIMPSNKTGENPLWQSNEPYFDDIVTQWDRYKSLEPYLYITQPEYSKQSLQSYLSIARHEGWLMSSRLADHNGRVQGGTHTGLLLLDAFLKPRYKDTIDWNEAYDALIHDAQNIPEYAADDFSPDGSVKQGRGALRDWVNMKYIPTNNSRSVSRATEYALDDFAVYKMGLGLGLPTDQTESFLNRSRQWRNHYDPDTAALGHSGFLVPINPDGVFLVQDPLDCGGCYWSDAYYQGNPYEYTFAPYHDLPALISLSGGNEGFVEKLEALFTARRPEGGRWYSPGNQVFFNLPYLFNLAGRQDLSVKISREIAQTFFTTSVDGLPGNSDSGALQSWLVWNMIGLYPLTGTNAYLVGSPWFETMAIDVGNGKKLEVTSSKPKNTRRGQAIYVQSLKVNGAQWHKSWVSWMDVFENGGTMEFTLGVEPRRWTTEDIPPGLASQDPTAGAVTPDFYNSRELKRSDGIRVRGSIVDMNWFMTFELACIVGFMALEILCT